MPPTLIVHGGAWDIPDDEVDAHVQGCRVAVEAGWAVLAGGGSSLDAIEAAVRAMEDDPTYDAGVGSVLNHDGDVELDAAVMEGASLRSGAVAAVRRVRNPITLARRVLESEAVLLAGEGAERFAARRGVPLCGPAELVVPRERARWEELLRQESYRTPDAFQRPPGEVAGARGVVSGPTGTVGCVALDAQGTLAAGTSTGGTALKLPGRVGDSPIVGAGLYADNQSAAGSSTGWGESIVKVLLAKTAADLVAAGHHPAEAARRAIEILAARAHGLGGIILLDARGRVGFAFNTPRMAYAYRAGGELVTGI